MRARRIIIGGNYEAQQEAEAASSFTIARSLESRKHRKVDKENRRKKEIRRKQREEEDYWDEYEDHSLESSSDELECDEPSLDLPSSEEEEEERESIKDKRKEEGARKGLGDDEGEVPLENTIRDWEMEEAHIS